MTTIDWPWGPTSLEVLLSGPGIIDNRGLDSDNVLGSWIEDGMGNYGVQFVDGEEKKLEVGTIHAGR